MKKEELVLIWFNYNNYSFLKVEKILEKFDKIEDILDKNLVKNAFFDEKFNEISNKILETDFNKFEEEVLNDLFNYSLKAITYVSDDYPEKLKNIDDPPLVLYVKGNEKLLNSQSISIVGTRKPTTYGRIVCENFTKELSSAGLVTVSGLAYGIDTIVAESTLSVNGKTIAVLAGGLDSIYPSQNTGLAKRIIDNGGLLVSEYKVGHKPINYQFISRNRIVAGLGDGLLIVEAGKASGTMTTAKFALEQSRELFVVPGNITSIQSEGTNTLIDEMPDTFTISPTRILFKLGVKKNEKPKVQNQIDMTESNILDVLSNGETSFDDLCEKTGLSASILSSKLIKMEMFGLVKKGNGNYYHKM